MKMLTLANSLESPVAAAADMVVVLNYLLLLPRGRSSPKATKAAVTRREQLRFDLRRPSRYRSDNGRKASRLVFGGLVVCKLSFG